MSSPIETTEATTFSGADIAYDGDDDNNNNRDDSLLSSYITASGSSYDDDEEESEDEHESLISYSEFVLRGDVLQGHHVMTVEAFSGLLAVGTNQGMVVVLSRDDGRASTSVSATQQQQQQQQVLRNTHTDPISDVSCNVREEFIGCSDKAGFISVQRLDNPSDVWRKQMDTPIHSLALHPLYESMDDQPVVCAGTDKIYLVTKLLYLSHRRATVLWDGKGGRIFKVRWSPSGERIAWLCSSGLCIYNYASRAMQCVVPRPASAAPNERAELYPSTINWEDANTLLVGSGDWVERIDVNDVAAAAGLESAKRLSLSPSATDAPYRVCGLAPFGSERYIVLACTLGNEGTVKTLEVRIVHRATLADVYRGQMVVDYYLHPLQLGLACCVAPPSAAPLLLHADSANGASRLAQYPPDGTFYLVSIADTIVKVTPCNEDDHVDFLLRTGLFKEAYEYSLTHRLCRHSMQDISAQYLEELARLGDLHHVAPLLRAIVGTDGPAWEKWIYRFDQLSEAWRLLSVLPATKAIDKQCYDVVLLRCLDYNPLLFNESVRRFEGLFDASIMSKVLAMRYQESCGMVAMAPRPDGTASVPYTKNQQTAIAEAYGYVLGLQGRHEDALKVFLHLKDSEEIFAFIRRHKLYSKALEVLPELFECSAGGAVRLLLEHVPGQEGIQDNLNNGAQSSPTSPLNDHDASCLQPEAVVQRLERADRQYLWMYLSALHSSDVDAFAGVSRRHAQLVATLCVDYDRHNLLSFLKEMCPHLDRVREIYALCKRYNLVEEMVFLMSRIGREEEGLRVIVHQLKDMHKAVQYITEMPSHEEQGTLFRTLVQLVIDYTKEMPRMADGQRYLLHHTAPGDTFSSIARHYSVKADDVRRANPSDDSSPPSGGEGGSSLATAATSMERAPPASCIVPMSLLSALLEASADPMHAENAAIDASYLIRMLPEDAQLPCAGACMSSVTQSRADEMHFLQSVVQVAESDLSEYYSTLLQSRRAAVRVAPHEERCSYCLQAADRDMTVFACHHVYHPQCVVAYVAATDVLNRDPMGIDPLAFLERTKEFVKPSIRRTVPSCYLCATSGTSVYF